MTLKNSNSTLNIEGEFKKIQKDIKRIQKELVESQKTIDRPEREKNRREKEFEKARKKWGRELEKQRKVIEKQREEEMRVQKKIDAMTKEDQEFERRMEKIDRVAQEKISKLKTGRKSYQKSVDRILADAEQRKLNWRTKKLARDNKQVREEGNRKTIKQTRKKINVVIKESAHYKNAVNYVIENPTNLGPEMFLDACKVKVANLIRKKHTLKNKRKTAVQICKIKRRG